jgi:hypothetical protein
MIRLSFVEGQSPWVVEFPGPVVSIGRKTPADAVIWDMNVSRHHCDLVEEGGVLRIFDRSSSGGTYVNQVRVSAGYPLAPGDISGFSGWLFRAELVPAPVPLPAGAAALLARLAADIPALHAALRGCPALVNEVLARPDLPAALLDDLSTCPSRDIQQAVARHPGTPASTLRRMAFYYRAEIEQNPALPLLLLEDPSLARKLRG